MTGLDRSNDEELEAALRSLGGRIDWPEAPDVADEVTREIRRREEHPVPLPRTGGSHRWARPLLIAAALLVPVAGTAIAATLLWDLGGITVEIAPPTSGPLPSSTLNPTALGRLITLANAPTEVGFIPIYPESLGAPDAVYAAGGTEAYVVLAWSPAEGLPPIEGTPWGAVLFEIPGEDAFISKGTFPGQVGPTLVDGDQALWVRGEHPLRIAGNGEEFRVTGNVLLWNEQDYAMRFESLLRQDDAVRVAEEIVIL